VLPREVTAPYSVGMVRLGVRRVGIAAAVLLVALGFPVPGFAASGAVAEPVCATPERIFAVDGTTGHLVELEECPTAVVEVGEVDAGDWRTARQVVATGDDTVTVVYTLTEDGRLESRRQDAPGAALGAPVEVGVGIDWSQFRSVVVPRRGFLWADGADVRTFRHVDWDNGGATLVEGPVAFPSRGGWPALGDLMLTGMDSRGRAEAVFMSTHWRIWKDVGGGPHAYPNGRLPNWRLSGDAFSLYTVIGGGVARLHQPFRKPVPPEPSYSSCVVNARSWEVRASLPGDWSLVVAPERAGVTVGEWPVVAEWPRSGAGHCPPGIGPYEWQ
jgi:hypothetical protein